MKKILFILVAALLLFVGCKAQRDPVEKATQKAEQDAEKAIWNEKAIQALTNREFVLEADRIDFRNGRFAYVNASTNFISLHGEEATIQMAFSSPYAGPNGIGGITVEGRTSRVKMETNKKGDISFSMMVQGIGVSVNVLIKLYKGDNKCEAIITPNFSGNRINFRGNLYEKGDSNIFKGRAL